MKRLLLVAYALTLVFGFVLNSHALTMSLVDGIWSNPVGGSNIQFFNGVVVGYGNGLQDQIRWGVPLGAGQSGLGFTGIAPPDQIFGLGAAFEIGQLQHFNFPIDTGTAPSAVQLGIALNFSDPSGLNGTFNFTFGIDETPNDPGPPASDDIISFPNSIPSESFSIGGIDYTLQLLGFGDSPSNLLTSFRSPEGGTNSALLWGQITAAETNPIPEPTSMILFGTGLFGFACYIKKKLKK